MFSEMKTYRNKNAYNKVHRFLNKFIFVFERGYEFHSVIGFHEI